MRTMRGRCLTLHLSKQAPTSLRCPDLGVKHQVEPMCHASAGTRHVVASPVCSKFLLLFKGGRLTAPAGPLCLWPGRSARRACGWRRSRRAPAGRRRARTVEQRRTEQKRCPRRTGRSPGWPGTQSGCGSSGTTCHPDDLHKGYRTASRGRTQPNLTMPRTCPLDPARSGETRSTGWQA